MRYDRPATLVEVLEDSAARLPDLPRIMLLADGDLDERSLSYAELDRQARAIAVRLKEVCKPGDRVLLFYPFCLEYVAAIFGCFYAGMVAVPAYPPNPIRLAVSLGRMRAIIDNAEVSAILCTEELRAAAEAFLPFIPEASGLHWISTDRIEAGTESTFVAPPSRGDDLALLQYTSGSTGTPKGVMLTHANLIANIRMFMQWGSQDTVAVTWLPLYHDMGLIGKLLGSVYTRSSLVMVPTLKFLERPMRWLSAISRYRATLTGGPNFAYELVARKSTPEERASLDLSSLDCVINGAEPVRARTLELFSDTFAPCGFRRQALRPTYGLAEATVFATSCRDELYREVFLDGSALDRGQVVHVSPGKPRRRSFVGVGRPAHDARMLVVDPTTHRRVPESQVGEVWLAGPHIGQGYWKREEESRDVFGAHLADDPAAENAAGIRYLRTGDIGFVDRGELFICGRRKDAMIIRGRNHAAEDIEESVRQAGVRVRSGSLAAFSADVEGEERAILVAEVDASKTFDAEHLAREMRQVVSANHGLQLHQILFLQPGEVPRTSSGKIQRHACKQKWMEGSLEVVAKVEQPRAESEPPSDGDDTSPNELGPDALAHLSSEARVDTLLPHLRREVAAMLSVHESAVLSDRAIGSLGLDSLRAVELRTQLESRFGIRFPIEALAADSTLEGLSRTIAQQIAVADSPRIADPKRTDARESSVERRIASRAATHPHSPAIAMMGNAMSLGELNARANQFARYLKAVGVLPGSVVALAWSPRAEALIALLGIMKAGGICMPHPLNISPAGARLGMQPVAHAVVPRYEDNPADDDGLARTWVDLVEDTCRGQSPSDLRSVSVAEMAITSAHMGQRTPLEIGHEHLVRYVELREARADTSSTLALSVDDDALIAALDSLWALSHGRSIRDRSEHATSNGLPGAPARPSCSLMYFARDADQAGSAAYDLVLEGARLADREGFEAVWIPERHFHPFGGLYPNPSVLGAALAVTTSRVRIRAGSVVMPLHDPVRVAEEWAVVDNLSRGRVDLSFAAGWHPRDFALAPENYSNRAANTLEGIDAVRALWEGRSVRRVDGRGDVVELHVRPRPVQRTLNTWLTAVRPVETFRAAGAIGANVLTALMVQTEEELAEKIGVYRAARTEHGHDPDGGRVTVMLHTFVGENEDHVRKTIRAPFKTYLASATELWSRHEDAEALTRMSERERDQALEFAVERYYQRSALFGAPERVSSMLERLGALGVSEVACLIDFGVSENDALRSLERLAEVQRKVSSRAGTDVLSQTERWSLLRQSGVAC